MKPIEVVPIPFYMIGVGLVGPLKTTSQGNKYILSVIDYCTKYAEAIALPNQEAVTVAKALEDVFARHGMPSVLLTNQGKNFESKVVASLCEMFGTSIGGNPSINDEISINSPCKLPLRNLNNLVTIHVRKPGPPLSRSIPTCILINARSLA